MSFKGTALFCVLILREIYLELSVIYIKVLNICLHVAYQQAWNSGLARMASLSQKQVTRPLANLTSQSLMLETVYLKAVLKIRWSMH